MGYRVDEGIKEAVTVWNLLDCPTSSSCGGHPYNKNGHGEPYPWLQFNMIMSPSLKEEKKLLEKIRKQVKSQVDYKYKKKYGTDKSLWSEKVISEWNRYLYKMLKSSQPLKSKEALNRVKKANDILRKKIEGLIKEFYENNTPSAISYKVRSFDDQHVVLFEPTKIPRFSGKKDTNLFFKKTQKEMNKITQFLKRKFFNY